MSHQLWIFRLTGPEAMVLEIPGNPPLRHGGGMSVNVLMLTDAQAAQVAATCKGYGFEVIFRVSEEETEQERADRLAILGTDSRVFPCTACPSCYWFDPLLDGVCGRRGWPEDMVRASLAAHEAARTDEAACPVKAWRV